MDKILEEMMEYICDKRCRYPNEVDQEELDEICDQCAMNGYIGILEAMAAGQSNEEIQAYRAIGTVEEVKNAYGRGYNQGGIDRAEELQKCREYGYNKAIDGFVSRLEKHTQENWIDHQEYGITWSDIEMIAEQLKGGADSIG